MRGSLIRRAVDFAVGVIPGTENAASLAFVLVVPAVAATGVGVDLATAYLAQSKLDAAAQAAAEAAISEGRVIRAARGSLPMDELASKGAGRADLVFNAQKPTVRDIATKVSVAAAGQPNVYQTDVSYQASVGTVFLRLAGVGELKLNGSSSVKWAARDAILDDRFSAQIETLRDRGSVWTASVDGWAPGGNPRTFGGPYIMVTDPARYSGGLPPADVTAAVELDTPDGNAYISKKVVLEQGLHQLRYWYRSLGASDAVGPAWLCGTRAVDVEWMKGRDRSAGGDTNLVSAYLMPESSAGAAIKDASFGPAYRVDACYSSGSRWIQRVVKIDVAARGEYRLAFRGEGQQDGVGGAIAHVLLCREPCAQDDGGPRASVENVVFTPDEVIFQDDFSRPKRGGLVKESADRWITPNGAKLTPVRMGEETFIQLDAAEAGTPPENLKMSRGFFLAPGHYSLRYRYAVSKSQTGKAQCNFYGMPADPGLVAGGRAFTNVVTVHIDADRSVLHPEAGPDGQVSWLNVNGAPDAVYSGYRLPALPLSSSAVDFCADQPDGAAAQREVNFNVPRPGYYWITFAAGGAADGAGGRIGDVQLVARQAREQTMWRIVSETTPWIPQVGSWLNMPTGAQGKAIHFRVQAQ